jgi:catechol 2,3-dioxygenase-like lactoylglutathione lyase family enzyme
MLPGRKIQAMPGRTLLRMALRVEKISAVTFRVLDMRASVRFYRDALGMELLSGGEHTFFSSLRAKDGNTPILNLEQGRSVPGWGRMIFYVDDVDTFWEYLRDKGFAPEKPCDASWGERYFHMPDPDGHELSFAHPTELTAVRPS